MELSVKAKNWLRQRAEQGKRGLQKERLSATLREIIAFCDEHAIDIGKQADNKHFLFNFDKLPAIRELCDFQLDLSDKNRVETANLKSTGSEKQAGINPLDYRILAAFQNQHLTPHYSPSTLVVELDIREVDLTAFSHLLVVENRDCFNDFYSHFANHPLDNPLIIYRGHNQESKWVKSLREQWKQQNTSGPTVYFGDFDLPGLSIAMQYEQLLLPAQEWLEQNVQAEHHEAGHLPYVDSLVQTCPEGWRPLLNIILSQHKALRQQWMKGVGLVCCGRLG